ncbi:MAG: TetR/AcrR family transcriptional regulator [Sinimarinibacterium sp.]
MATPLPLLPLVLPRRQFSERQQELLAQLERLFLREGFSRLTIGDIVERLSCSRTTLYQIARSKEDLVLVVVDRWQQRMQQRAVELRRGLDKAADIFYAWSELSVEELADMSIQFLDDVNQAIAVRQLVNHYNAHSIRAIEQILADGIARGEIRDLDPHIAAQFFSLGVMRLDALFRDEQMRHTGKSAGEIARELYRVFIYGIQPLPAERQKRAARPIPGNGAERRGRKA